MVSSNEESTVQKFYTKHLRTTDSAMRNSTTMSLTRAMSRSLFS